MTTNANDRRTARAVAAPALVREWSGPLVPPAARAPGDPSDAAPPQVSDRPDDRPGDGSDASRAGLPWLLDDAPRRAETSAEPPAAAAAAPESSAAAGAGRTRPAARRSAHPDRADPAAQYPGRDEPRDQQEPGQRANGTGLPTPGADRGSDPVGDGDGEGERALVGAVRPRPTPPREGWRRVVHQVTGWNPGLSAAEARRIDQRRRMRTPLAGPHSTVVVSLKGGIGKTTTAAVLGRILSEHRGDRVAAVDANPDAGTLGARLVGPQAAATTVRDLLDDLDLVRSSTDLGRYTHLAGSLQVISSDRDPEEAEAFGQIEYEHVLAVLSQYVPVIITDCGTGVVHSAMQGSLAHADSLVLAGDFTQDGASLADATLDYLTSRRGDLARDAIVVLSHLHDSPGIDQDVIRRYFRRRCRAVIELPRDPHLATGGVIDLAALRRSTRDAAFELAATVGDGFGHPTRGLAAHSLSIGPRP